MKEPGVLVEKTFCKKFLETTCHECEEDLITFAGETIYLLQMSEYPHLCERCYTLRIAGKTHDPVNSPSHYTSHPSGVECREITRHYSCMIGAAIKYLWRAGLKQDVSALVVNPGLVDVNKMSSLKPGDFVQVDPTTVPSVAIRQLTGISNKTRIQDYNKALFCIMDEIDKLGGKVTARPREKN